MTRFASFENNKGVVDVLCCIINGKESVKEIVKKLKQPQTSVSRKIEFLIRNKVIIKDKWDFKPNWKTLTKIFQKEIKRNLEEPGYIGKDNGVYLDAKEKKTTEDFKSVIEKIPIIFNEKRVVTIYKKYADYFNEGWLTKMSSNELADMYINALRRTDNGKFNKLNEDIIKVKDLFNRLDIMDMEEDFFTAVESELKS